MKTEQQCKMMVLHRPNIRWRRCARSFLTITFITMRRDNAASVFDKEATTIIQPIRNRPRMHLQRYLQWTRPCPNLKRKPSQCASFSSQTTSLFHAYLKTERASFPLFLHKVFVKGEDDSDRQKNTCSASNSTHEIGNHR